MGDPSPVMRLSKLMSEKGLCSRREADAWIAKGMVFVNGQIVRELGTKVSPEVRVTLAPEALRAQKDLLTVILNKPIGYVSSTPEDDYPHALSLILPENQWAAKASEPSRQRIQTVQDLKGLAPAGRLDIDSQGLIVFTQDGRLAKQLIGAESTLDKEYLVRVEGQVTGEILKQLRFGLVLDDKPLRQARVEQRERNLLVFTLREGRKRQIRRMCELVGLRVTFLKRVRIGRLHLGELPTGQWLLLENSKLI